MSVNYNSELWHELLENGEKNQSHKEINILSDFDYRCIIDTLEFFGSTDIWIKQSMFDLKIAKYRIFDWIAMCINGRNLDVNDKGTSSRRTNNTALKVLVYAFKQANYDERKFADNMHHIDYDIDRKWENIQIDLKQE